MTATPPPVPPARFIRDLADLPAEPHAPTGTVTDQHRRDLRDLRISVTDRCNFRCVYCMPKDVFGRDYAFMERSELLTFEEITRLASIAVEHGVEKIRLTGGEPLLRTGLEDLVARLAALRTPDGRPIDIALTTNGSALAHKAQALKDAGLNRVTVSLDSLDDELFQAMNDVKFPLARVLNGIRVAHEVGLGPIKVNMVVKRGQNDADILPMARHFADSPYVLRFIEYMDVGSSNGWKLDEVVPSAEVIELINRELPVEKIAPSHAGETAERYRYVDGGGEIGVISSVTKSFCSQCTRLRISTEGKLFTCLFANEGHDLRALLRDGATDEQLATAMAVIWRGRDDRYSDLRSAGTVRQTSKKIEMSYIGG